MNGQEITLQRKSTGCTSGKPSDCKGHTRKLFDEQHKAQEKKQNSIDHSNNCSEHSEGKKKTFQQLKLFCLTSTTQNPGQLALSGS